MTDQLFTQRSYQDKPLSSHRFDYESKLVNSRVALLPSNEITVLKSRKNQNIKSDRTVHQTFRESPDIEYQSDQQINYEFVANENINESNILQSTKNKFKKSFVFQEDSNTGIMTNRSEKVMVNSFNHKPEISNRISAMYDQQQSSQKQQIQKQTQNKNKSKDKSQNKQEGSNKLKLQKLEQNYIELQCEFDKFKMIQIQVTTDLKGQISQLWKILESCKCKDKNSDIQESDPKKTEFSQRFEKIISPFLNKQRSVKFSRNLSPNCNNSNNENNNLSFNVVRNSSNKRNLKLFKTSIKDDKIYFQTSVVSSEKSILAGPQVSVRTEKSAKNLSNMKMFSNEKEASAIVNSKCMTLQKPKNLVINVSDSSQERDVLKEVKTPNVNNTNIPQQTAKNCNNNNTGKKNLFEYNKNLSVRSLASQSHSNSRNHNQEAKYEPCSNYNPHTQSSFSKDINMLSENVEEEHDLLLANNGIKVESTLENDNTTTVVMTQNKSLISLPKYKITMTQVMSPTRREFNSMDEIIKDKINDKDYRERAIAVEGFIKEKYSTAPQFFSSKNECLCAEFSDKCINRFCKFSVSAQVQNQIVMEELDKLYSNFKKYSKRPDISGPLDLLRASVGLRNERKYLICSKWWQQWCDYTNFKVSNGSLSDRSPYKQNDYFQDTERVNNSRRDLDQSYARPGIIKNQYLLLNNQSMALRQNLIEVFDYVAVPQAIWKYLYSWYSTDWSISRKLVQDSIAGSFVDKDIDTQNNYDVLSQDEEEAQSNKRLTLDLYPYHCRYD